MSAGRGTLPAELRLRPASSSDVVLVTALIHELAEYERLAETCVADEASVGESLFGDRPAAEVVLAFLGDEPAGFALFFENYSTHLSRRGIFLEDLFVREPLRGRGVGGALLAHLAKRARDHGYGRVEWNVLRWNKLAIDVYERVGASAMEEWVTYRLTGDALSRVADRAAD